MRKRLLHHLSFTKPKRLVLILLTLLLTLPQTAWGQTTYNIWIGDFEGNGSFAGTRVTSENANDVLGNGTVSYADGVLTLNGANIQGTIYINGDLTIDLKGKNYITANDSSAITNVNTAKNIGLTFKSTDGTGFLTTVAKPNTYNYPCSNGFNAATYNNGLSCLSGGLRFDDGAYEYAIIGQHLFSGGTGASNTPYLIATAADLKDFSSYVNQGWITTNGIYFKLGQSSESTIDCTGLTGFEPIGTGELPFIGKFDGNNCTIKNLTYSTTEREDYVGLFGIVGSDDVSDAKIEKLTLSNCSFNGGGHVGGIVGMLINGTIENCVLSSCTVKGGDAFNLYAGGIAGSVDNGTITTCTFNSGLVDGETAFSGEPSTAYAGGIVGCINTTNSVTISSCTVSSTNVKSVTSGTDGAYSIYVGGIVGRSLGTVAISDNKVTTTDNTKKISCQSSVDFTNYYCGAIIGDKGDATLSNNTYESDVTTEIAGTSKTGYTQRGIGQHNDVLGQVQLDGITMVTIVHNSNDGGYGPTTNPSENYYMYEDGAYYVLSGYDLTLTGTPTQGHKPRLTLSDATIEVTATDVKNPDTQVYTHTEFTFTVGNADLTATFTFPIDIASASYTATIADELYTGNPVVPTQMTLNDGNDDIILTTADDFTITGYTLGGTSVDEPVEAGTYTVTVEGKNDYIGTRNVTYKIIQTYALKIRGTQVNDANKDDILGSAGAATASFTPATATTPNTLTLNGASFEGKIESGLDELTIEFTGTNSLNGTSGYITSTNTNAALTLKGVTNGTNPSTLSLTNTVGVAAVEGFASVTLNDGSYLKTTNCCQYVSGDVRQYKDPHNSIVQNITFTTKPHYLLWIRDYQVSDDNKDDIFNDTQNSDPISATFDPSSNILTLNGMQSYSQFGIESGLDNLTISLIGSNAVYATYYRGYNSILSIVDNATLKIQKAEAATYDCELDLRTYGEDPVIKGFKSVDYTGLNFVSKTGTTIDAETTYEATLSSGTIYPLWIDGTMVTEANKNAILGAGDTSVTYDGDTNNGGTNTLTLNNYSYTGYGGSGHAIETNITGLKVKLVGASTINCTANSNYAFYTSQSTASIQFVKNDATSKLTLQTTPANPFGGFADGKITYDGLVYYPTDNYIAVPTAPVMAEDNNKVKLTRGNYEGGTIAIKYSITYADGETAGVTEATYSEPFAMAAPGTVTAWVEANNGNSSETKGKYFGYKDAPFTLETSGTKTPELIPAIETGDNIGYIATGAYESSATDVATFTGGTITGVGIGTATVTANLDYTSDVQPVVILNPNKKVTAEVNVGTIPNITFASGMTYATFCNTSNKDLTVPEGLTAYAVTGTNGNVVTLSQVDFLPKVDGTDYVALLLKREDTSATVGIALESAGGTRPTTNHLRYNFTAKTTTGNEYVLYKDEFLKAKGTIPDGKCYLDLSGMNAARGVYGISHNDGDDTGINNVMLNEHGVERWYDLQGRRIEKPTKAGLYIRNGEKIVVNDNNK